MIFPETLLHCSQHDGQKNTPSYLCSSCFMCNVSVLAFELSSCPLTNSNLIYCVVRLVSNKPTCTLSIANISNICSELMCLYMVTLGAYQ